MLFRSNQIDFAIDAFFQRDQALQFLNIPENQTRRLGFEQKVLLATNFRKPYLHLVSFVLGLQISIQGCTWSTLLEHEQKSTPLENLDVSLGRAKSSPDVEDIDEVIYLELKTHSKLFVSSTFPTKRRQDFVPFSAELS